VASVEARLATLEKLLLASTDGSLIIKATKVSLQAPVVEVKAANSILMTSSNSIEFKASAALSIGAGGTANVKAGILILNGGSRPLARSGDAITVTATGNNSPISIGTLTAGNATVLG
jgi:hypothetical protein